MTVTTTATYGSQSDLWAHRALLQRPKPRLVHNLFAKKFSLPSKNSDTIGMRRQENLNSDPSVLPEGGDPAPENIEKTDIHITVQEFGKVTLLSRKVLLVVEDDTAYETAENLNQCMHTMLDKVTRSVLASSVPQISCLNGSNGHAITEINNLDIRRAVEFLDEGDTEVMTPTIEGTFRFGSAPVEPSFWTISHVKLKSDLRNVEGFTPTSQYGSQSPVLSMEFGSIEESRFVTSTLATVDEGDPQIYHNIFLGADALGCVSIDEVSTEVILKPLGFNDRLNRHQSMGFTAFFAAGILDDSHIDDLLATKS